VTERKIVLLYNDAQAVTHNTTSPCYRTPKVVIFVLYEEVLVLF
jgi:hypothetical protein